jgi:hypothetical protein
MMITKRQIQFLIAISLLSIVLQACAQVATAQTDQPRATLTPGEVPTWTPRPDDMTLTALPTATLLAPVLAESADAPAVTITPVLPPTPKPITFTVSGGNLNVRRGPSVDFNYIGVMYDGETAIAVGRDRISRWVLVEVPSQPGLKGWVTTETEYSSVQGDVSVLPFVKVDPASPAYIRNCTKHEMLVMPNEVELLTKFDKPYNEERFGVGTYWVYDLEDPHREVIQEISLSEGRTVDIRIDWTGEKSKCE